VRRTTWARTEGLLTLSLGASKSTVGPTDPIAVEGGLLYAQRNLTALTVFVSLWALLDWYSLCKR
jgi:hypothetical protein